MAGQPKRRAMIDMLEQRTRDYFEWDGTTPQPTTLDYVAVWIEDGKTLKELAFDMGQALGYEIGRERVSAYLRDAFGTAIVDETLANARTRASHSMVDDTLHIADTATPEQHQTARVRINARQWVAEKLNRADYGSVKQLSVSGSIGLMHLTALQAVPARATAIVTGTPQQQLPAGDEQIVTIEEEG